MRSGADAARDGAASSARSASAAARAARNFMRTLAQRRKVELEVVTLGIEHIDRLAALALDDAMEFAQLLRFLERFLVVAHVHVERLVCDAVLVERVARERPRPLEQHDVAVAAAQPVEALVFAVNLDRKSTRLNSSHVSE